MYSKPERKKAKIEPVKAGEAPISLTPSEIEDLSQCLKDKTHLFFKKEAAHPARKYSILKKNEHSLFIISKQDRPLIGKGGYGYVKEAWRVTKSDHSVFFSDKKYVLKKFYLDKTDETVRPTLKNIKNELYFFNLVYGNSAEIYKYSKTGLPSIIMPRLDGVPLCDLDPKSKPLSLLKDLLAQLYIAYSSLRALNIIHGDINWDNILYCEKTHKAFVIDFGSAFFKGEKSTKHSEDHGWDDKSSLHRISWGIVLKYAEANAHIINKDAAKTLLLTFHEKFFDDKFLAIPGDEREDYIKKEITFAVDESFSMRSEDEKSLEVSPQKFPDSLFRDF